MIPATRYGRPFRRVDAHPFTPDRWRPLRVVLDDATLSDEQIALFNLFAEEEEIEVWHTQGDRLSLLELGEPFETPFRMDGALSVYGKSERSENMFGIYGTGRMAARAAELAETGEGAAEEILRALQFAAASGEMEADAFITERTSLSARGSSDPVIVSPADGFALIGLALRAHDNASIGSDLRYNRPGSSFFHFLLGRELLRESWPWFGGVVAYGEAHRDDESTGYLAQTGLERFQRVLQIRDRLHFAAKGEPTSTRFDEATFALETLLLFLSATFDTTARVAHLIYLGGSYEEAGWRRGQWLERLAGRAPELAAAVAEGSHGATLLQITRRASEHDPW